MIWSLRHQRALLGFVLAVIAVICWTWVVLMARDLYGPMTGWSVWMMGIRWDALHLALLWAMWAAMMAAMMIPAAAPMLLLHVGAAYGPGRGPNWAHPYVCAAGYLSVWAAFSLGAAALQRLLATTQLLSPTMEPAHPIVGASVLAIAGVYQLTPLKRYCLRACRAPIIFLSTRRYPGRLGAYRLGIEHGVFCLGCCWALMLLLFSAGVMNLFVIVALTIWILVEKLSPFGERSTRVSGILLIATAVWLATISF